jgi:hypothetical protein
VQEIRPIAASRAGVLWFCLCALLIGPGRIAAQVADSNLVGTLVDPSDAVVPDASVELRNEATGVRIYTTTDQKGSYRFLNLLTGSYTLTANAAGFTAVTVKGLVLELNRTQTANLRLEVGRHPPL